MASNNADREKLNKICEMTYKAQAIWFLNSFWDIHSGEAEKFWAYVSMANKIDIEKHEEGCALDELNAHRLLEIFDETLTVREMRTQLRSVGAIDEASHPKLVPLAHLLLARYKADWHHFVNAPQGNKEEIDAANAKLNACKAAFQASEARAAEAAEALRQAESAEAAAKQREQEARDAEAAAKAREQEARDAEAAAKQREQEAREAEAAAKQREQEARDAEAAAKQREASAKASAEASSSPLT